MIIVYESKTGFTKRYADMLSAQTRLKVFRVKEENLEPVLEWLNTR